MSVSYPFTITRASFQPAYLKLWESGQLSRRVELGLEKLADCALCPRNCHVNRLEDATKVCKTGRYATVSSHFAHSGEERCLSGSRGSGTIFFSSCNLRCVFCQNWDISKSRQIERKLADVGRDSIPLCPVCGKMMVLRTHRVGADAGQLYYGCIDNPGCPGTVPLKE